MNPDVKPLQAEADSSPIPSALFERQSFGNLTSTVTKTSCAAERVERYSVELEVSGLSQTSVGKIKVSNLSAQALLKALPELVSWQELTARFGEDEILLPVLSERLIYRSDVPFGPGFGFSADDAKKILLRRLILTTDLSAAEQQTQAVAADAELASDFEQWLPEIEDIVISPECMRRFLEVVQQQGGAVFSDQFGIEVPTIVANYNKILESVNDEEAEIEYFQIGPDGCSKLSGELGEKVRDPQNLVWIKVETSLSTRQAHDDKLDYIITERLMPKDSELQALLDEAWNRERGVQLDVRIVHAVTDQHFKVEKIKLLLLLGQGFVLTVADGEQEREEGLYQDLKKAKSSDPVDFALQALQFGLNGNENLIIRLTQKHYELHGNLWKRTLSKQELRAHDEYVDQLIDSAEYIRNQTKDYVEALAELVEISQANQQELAKDALDDAEEVLEQAQSLLTDAIELRDKIKDIRETRSGNVELLAGTHGVTWTIFATGLGCAFVLPSYGVPIIIGSVILAVGWQRWYQGRSGE